MVRHGLVNELDLFLETRSTRWSGIQGPRIKERSRSEKRNTILVFRKSRIHPEKHNDMGQKSAQVTYLVAYLVSPSPLPLGLTCSWDTYHVAKTPFIPRLGDI